MSVHQFQPGGCTGCPRKNVPMFAHFLSKSANMGTFFLGHPVEKNTDPQDTTPLDAGSFSDSKLKKVDQQSWVSGQVFSDSHTPPDLQ